MAGSKFKKKYQVKGGKKLTRFISPMKARVADQPFDDEDWIFEIKWDGYRAIAELNDGDLKFYSRNGNSFLSAYPVLADQLRKIKKNIIVDGEIVVLNEKGLPDFQKLQDYATHSHLPIHYYVFDLLQIEGEYTWRLPLLDRKKLLRKIIKNSPTVHFSDHIEKEGIRFFKEAVKKDLEGIMAKHKQSLYHPGKRTSDWLKIKHHKTEDVIIAGYTEPSGNRNYFGSLVLGMKDGKALRYIGNAGTGYDEASLKNIFKRLQKLKRHTSPFTEPVKIPGITWVHPKLICEVKFSEWTNDGKLRHPVFLKLRDDKSVKEIDMKSAKPVTHVSKPVKRKKAEPGKANDEMVITSGKVSVPVSHPNKIYWPGEGITKGMMVDYYQSVAKYLLPYLKDRPESLKRNPGGIRSKGFFQKDAAENAPSWVKSYSVYSESSDKQVDYIVCNDKQTLAYLNNLGCIELNPWNSVTAKPDHPDYLIIDIDPSEKNSFDQVVDAALQFKKLLDQLSITGYCKTSGASGLHIFIPTARKYNYEQVKDFAHLLCMKVQEQIPSFTTLERSLKKRGKSKIYLDYLQNRKGQTIASAYSLRPRPGATVSMPLDWKEVKRGLSPQSFTIHNTLTRIKKKGDLFKGVLGPGVNLQNCLKKIGSI